MIDLRILLAGESIDKSVLAIGSNVLPGLEQIVIDILVNWRRCLEGGFVDGHSGRVVGCSDTMWSPEDASFRKRESRGFAGEFPEITRAQTGIHRCSRVACIMMVMGPGLRPNAGFGFQSCLTVCRRMPHLRQA